ncbi:sn-glycerol-3-phosphate ABC transporter ATP-binding protein UgpC [Mollicutes bacterium LVI A0039]|nr:sn-glycerol-3-phosphate ABC transporter ATP-binding protein UgpC [Mollicutes bacterium LVI A0039]
MIELKNIQKKYKSNSQYSVKDFNLQINEGEFIVFVGPSGCGKSTTLRMVAGLEDITEGELLFDGEAVNTKHPKDRDIAMVFQDYALYPHMTVRENMGFGLKVRKISKDEINQKVEEAAKIIGLEEFLEKKPKNLSGGQRQRVALGRAIVRSPRLFLMDEPLSNLDAKLRVSTRVEITNLQKRLGVTTIYVTHDQVEAMTMADRMVVMSDGEVQQIGTPIEIYDRPNNLFVAKFIGQPQINIIKSVYSDGAFTVNGDKLTLPKGIMKKLTEQLVEGKEYAVGIRPEHLRTDRLSLTSELDTILTTEMEVRHVENMGNEFVIYMDYQGQNVIAKIDRRNEKYEVGDKISIGFDLNRTFVFNYETGENIIG